MIKNIYEDIQNLLEEEIVDEIFSSEIVKFQEFHLPIKQLIGSMKNGKR